MFQAKQARREKFQHVHRAVEYKTGAVAERDGTVVGDGRQRTGEGDATSGQRHMDICRRREKPVLIHTNEPVGHLYAGKTRNTLSQIYQMIRRFPENRIVLAHWGGGIFFYNLLKKEEERFKKEENKSEEKIEILK
jgi:predicted TIM-barrel fold metal-dependent hydrolase